MPENYNDTDKTKTITISEIGEDSQKVHHLWKFQFKQLFSMKIPSSKLTRIRLDLENFQFTE